MGKKTLILSSMNSQKSKDPAAKQAAVMARIDAVTAGEDDLEEQDEEEQDEEAMDDDFDDDELGDDYNAEQYFDNGDDNDENDGGGEEDY
jgi:DNA-directed RNA polymerase III subunit RPC7